MPKSVASCWRALYATKTSCFTASKTAQRWRWRTPVGTAFYLSRSAPSLTTTCAADIMDSGSTVNVVVPPSQETMNPSACVRAFPIVERHRFVWIWPGDPALADPTLVPDLRWMNDPAWTGDGRMTEVKADYRLVIDNLMDLTHETYVHGSSIGNEALAKAPFDAVHGETTATIL